MERINGREVIVVTKFYNFVEGGYRVSSREVLDEVEDLFRECKSTDPADFSLRRTEVDENNPAKLKDVYFSLEETSPEFKAFAEVIMRYYLGREDFEKERFAKYFSGTEPGTAYLVNRGLIPQFNKDDKEIVRLDKLMDQYCAVLAKRREARMQS